LVIIYFFRGLLKTSVRFSASRERTSLSDYVNIPDTRYGHGHKYFERRNPCDPTE